MSVLFICRENVGRSQIAEALYFTMTGKPATSAATHVNIENQSICDRPLAEPVIRLMQQEGIDISNHRANQVTEQMIQQADVIVVMNRPETIPEYLQHHLKAIYWKLQDPSGKDDAFLTKIIAQIKEKLTILIGN